MWYNSIMAWILYSPLHGMLSRSMMVLDFKGRKSGKRYRVPVSYLQSGDTLLTVSFKNRTWWRNLRGGVPVTVRLRGKDTGCQGEVIEDEQGVASGLGELIGSDRRTARMLGVRLGADSRPDPASLRQAASSRVIVRTTLG